MQATRPSLASIQNARERLATLGMTSPLVPLRCGTGAVSVFLKLENLQPVGSFKVRPVGNAVLSRAPALLERGIATCSSGNSGLALAWMAQRLGIEATVILPVGKTPGAKLERLQALGARLLVEPMERWWQAVQNASHPDVVATYIDAVRDPAALAGNGTMALEILEQVPEVEAIFVPLGGGALACGIASAVRACRPEIQVIACELESAQPFASALRAGKVVSTPSRAGFVSGVGFDSMLPDMWSLTRELVDGALSVSLGQVAGAIRAMAQGNRVIAEGAGALSVAAALGAAHPFRRVCAVVSGGNLNPDMLSTILAGGVPA